MSGWLVRERQLLPESGMKPVVLGENIRAWMDSAMTRLLIAAMSSFR